MSTIENMTIPCFLPIRSLNQSPINAPTGPPNDISVLKPSDAEIVNPCFTKKVGSQAANPNETVFNAISKIVPTKVLAISSLEKRTRSGIGFIGAGTDTAGSERGPLREASFSTASKTASASSSLPFDFQPARRIREAPAEKPKQ